VWPFAMVNSKQRGRSIVPIPHRNAADFQNLMVSLSSEDAFLVKFHEDPFNSFYVKLLNNGRKDRLTPGVHNVVGGGNKRTEIRETPLQHTIHSGLENHRFLEKSF